MELIDTEQRARRLARTVAMDIVLYNEKQIGAGADLSREIAEGRSHFCSRVTPALHWIFEDVLATTPLGKGTQSSEARVEAPRVQAPPAKPSSRPPPASSSGPSVQTASFEASPIEPDPARAPSGAPCPSSSVVPQRIEVEPPRAPSSAPPPERAEPETEPAPPECAPAPEPAPVGPAITQPAANAESRSGAGLVVVLLCALAVVLAVSWFVLR